MVVLRILIQIQYQREEPVWCLGGRTHNHHLSCLDPRNPIIHIRMCKSHPDQQGEVAALPRTGVTATQMSMKDNCSPWNIQRNKTNTQLSLSHPQTWCILVWSRYFLSLGSSQRKLFNSFLSSKTTLCRQYSFPLKSRVFLLFLLLSQWETCQSYGQYCVFLAQCVVKGLNES